MNKKRKKALTALSYRLPPSWEVTKVSEYMKGEDLITSDEQHGLDKIHPNVIYKSTGKKLIRINHKQKLKRAWSRNKTAGVMEYIKWLDNNNRYIASIVKQSEDVKQVDEGILNIAKGSVSSFWRQLIIFLSSFISVFASQTQKETT